MKKVTTFVAILSLKSVGWAGTDREAANSRLDRAGKVLHAIMMAGQVGQALTILLLGNKHLAGLS